MICDIYAHFNICVYNTYHNHNFKLFEPVIYIKVK